jgi:lipopolysaccharide/colanic/teichoic acid biosynthesis glycosyltransferase
MTDIVSRAVSPFVPARPLPIDPLGGGAKRSLDVVFSVCLCILLAPVLLGTALLIKVLDGGPVFFVQMRIGLAAGSLEGAEW